MKDCPKCHGEGCFRENVLAGYVTREMAMDACDMAYENQPIYQEIDIECNYCNGSGHITDEEFEAYENPKEFDPDDIPF